ncbi:NAD(P)/FAD-dependent oxidoreductase [Prescottella sp. R16]|uniref:flavin-containing monooxygenase n=1 Tax=Prescottella sp. R16 TaxID=3064529 RepID=UPI00272E8A79|nr:NAD(P)/FAD-dependent oxidoreductase [Prescottella sp. R16]
MRDPYTPVVEREPKTDHVTFAFIGGGFSGLLTAARLRESGIDSVRVIDKAGDFGGVWYWNRYPGAMCDTAAMVYMPLLEETGHMPTEKYAHGPEIYEHCQRIGKHYGLYDDALFHTQVTDLAWQEQEKRWLITTDRGDRFTAQFVGMGTGPLHVAQLPGIPGIENFRGKAFHTSRWDYNYTGGDPTGAPMDLLADKRVAVIGTGATAVQCVPELAKYSKELFVFQRTPSAVDVRGNHPIDPQWFDGIATPGWQQRWLDSFTAIWDGVLSDPSELENEHEDLVQDGWTALGKRMRAAVKTVPAEDFSLEAVQRALEDADDVTTSRIRDRVDEIVTDTDTAESLKAWFRQMCKRPCFHDDYLPAFNRPNTHLVDTNGKGVERITAGGVVVDGVEYEVDCIVYASGFEFLGTDFTDRAGFDVTGRDGVTLSQYWADGMRSLQGMFVRGFPNLFIQQLLQGSNLGSNIPHNFVEGAKTVKMAVDHTLRNGFHTVEPTAEAEDAWVQLLLDHGRPLGNPECTPGYYNNEGKPAERKDRLNVGYPQGSAAFFRMMNDWRAAGTMDGLTFD